MIIANKLLRGVGTVTGVNSILATDNPNLVAMFTMDNISGSTLFDESPNNVDGIISGATAVTGKIDNALSFDGIDDTVKHSTWNVPSGDFVISVWLKIPATHNAEMTPVNQYHTLDGRRAFRVDLLNNAGNVRYQITGTGNEADFRTITTGNGQNDNLFHHYIFSFEGGTELALFVDKTKVDSNTTSIPASIFTGTGEDLKLGHLTAGGGANPALFYNGDIDQLRLFDRILTQGEINTLFDEGG